jgi:hypothetical protein
MLKTVVDASLPIFGLFITLLFAWLAKQIDLRMKVGASKDVAIELKTAAETVVRSLEKSLRPQLVAASRDGKLSAADGQTLKDAAMVQLNEQLSEVGKKVLESNATRVEQALERAIEAQVQIVTTEPKEVPPATAEQQKAKS